ncbi:MAG: hexose kinase, partial [Firmicutes bacterium]|nr:hexose kinase [Bacillota bacterium]
GFLAGHTGRLVAELLRRERMASDFLWVRGETRTNLKLVDAAGVVTEVNEPGPEATPADLEALIAKLTALGSDVRMLAVGGSALPGVAPEDYGRLVRLGREQGRRVVLDADGEALQAGLQERPYLVKPNAAEAAHLFGAKPGTLSEAAEMAAALVDHGVELALISLGVEGCAFATREQTGWARSPAVPVRCTVGAGDSLIAGTVAALLDGRSAPEAVCQGVAVAASAVAQEGPGRPNPQQAQSLLTQITMDVRP